jgi:hypothetical protein
MDQLNSESVQKEFTSLIKELSVRALWFCKDPGSLRIVDPVAGQVLEKMMSHCSKDQWIRIRKVIKWRSQNIK